MALDGSSKVPRRLHTPTTAAHRAALEYARGSALRLVRRSYALRSARRGPVLEEHWSRAKVLIGETKLPIDGYETGIRTGKMNKACSVPLRADRVSLPETSGQFDVAAFLPADMRHTYEDPELLRVRDGEQEIDTADQEQALLVHEHDATRNRDSGDEMPELGSDTESERVDMIDADTDSDDDEIEDHEAPIVPDAFKDKLGREIAAA